MSFRSARLKAEVTVEAVKTALGVSGVSVWQWERGLTVPDARKLPALAALYNCTVDELLDGNPVREKKK